MRFYQQYNISITLDKDKDFFQYKKHFKCNVLFFIRILYSAAFFLIVPFFLHLFIFLLLSYIFIRKFEFESVLNLQISVWSRMCRWAQIFTDGRMPLECGTGQRLILTNVTYEQQGQYICLASNKINGKVREVKSDPVSLQVVGAPRVRRRGTVETLKKFHCKSELPGKADVDEYRFQRIQREKISLHYFTGIRDH